jgi:hypothetical protein
MPRGLAVYRLAAIKDADWHRALHIFQTEIQMIKDDWKSDFANRCRT